MASVDLKAHAKAVIQLNQDRLVKDLKAIPEDKRTECPGGCSRTPLQLVAECGMVNGFVAKKLTGEEVQRPSPEERQAFFASFDTLEKTLSYLNEQTEKLLTVIESLDEEKMGEVNDQVFGRPMTLFALAEFPGLHMMYHDGQLNYIHTLYNDSEVHW